MRTISIDRERPDPAALSQAAHILDAGGVVIFPTDTLYGILARIDRPEALARIGAIKGHDDRKPMPCLAGDAESALAAFDPVPSEARTLARSLWPGPMTIVGPACPHLVGAATGSGPTIGVRVPRSEAPRRLAVRCGCLLAATSANPHGRMPALNAAMMREYFAAVEDLVFFDAGELDSAASTVVDLTTRPPRIARAGEIPRERIEAVLGRPLAEIQVRADERLQDLVSGPLVIIQKTRGFRYAVDALLLAAFVEFQPNERIVDIGSGSGVIPLLLAGRGAADVTGIESQAEMADMATRSVTANALGGRVRIRCEDVRRAPELFPAASFDVVCANPPYHPVDSGHQSPDEPRAISRHELTLTLRQTVAAAACWLRPQGRFFMIHLATRIAEIVEELTAAGFGEVRLRAVRTRSGADSRFVLVRATAARSGGTGPLVEMELVLHRPDGTYTDAAKKALAPLESLSLP